MAKKVTKQEKTENKNNKEKYELMVILKPLLPEDDRSVIENKVKNLITDKEIDGEIIEEDVWGKRHLAYEIQGYDEGYYIVYKCLFNPKKIIEFKNNMKLDNDIIRYLLIKL